MNNELIKQENGIAINMVTSRQSQEVQGAIFMAKQFPRNENIAIDRINKMCERKTLAERSTYTYPRGQQQVSGPSIRLAEAIAQAWGNIDYGVIELSNENGLSEMMAYCWDLETNVRRSMVFSVKHERSTKSGGYKLTDTRDIYELTANMGARRVRACILGVIPADIIDNALEICEKTLIESKKQDIGTNINNMFVTFEKKLKVNKAQIEKYLGKAADKITAEDLVKLGGIYDSIKEGMSKIEDYFEKDEVKNPLE